MDTQMKPMTVHELSRAGLLTMGRQFLCVRAADRSYFYTTGKTYDATDGELCSDQYGTASNHFNESTFVPVDEDEDEEEITPVEDIVENPNHYSKWEIQPIEFLMRNRVEGHVFNIVKYTMRAGYKLYPYQTAEQSEVTDLKKVISYAQRRINLIEGRPITDSGEAS